MSAVPLIDPTTIRNLRTLNTGDNDDFLREIVALFAGDVPARIAELEQALAEGDVRKFARAAHSIKGSSANLGARVLQSAAEKLEARALEAGLEGITPFLADLKEESARAQEALQKIVATPA